MGFIFALLASAFWGITYVVNEQVFKHISVTTAFAVDFLVIGLLALVWGLHTGEIKADARTISSSGEVSWLVLSGIAVLLIAEIFIALSIVNKNATLAGLIEITYPLFIALFAYILFRESQLTLMTALGGLLILSGVFVVYWFSR